MFPEAGLYFGVDNAMKNVLRGGAFAIVADDSEQAMANDHPEGTWLPPAGSDMVSGPSMMG